MTVGRRTLEESRKQCPGAKRDTEEKRRLPAREVVNRPNGVVNVPPTQLICPAVDTLRGLTDVVGNAALPALTQRLVPCRERRLQRCRGCRSPASSDP